MRVLLFDGLMETLSYVLYFFIFFYFEIHGTSEFIIKLQDRQKLVIISSLVIAIT